MQNYTFHSIYGKFTDFKVESQIDKSLLLTIHHCLSDYYNDRIQISYEDKLVYDGNQYILFYDKLNTDK